MAVVVVVVIVSHPNIAFSDCTRRAHVTLINSYGYGFGHWAYTYAWHVEEMFYHFGWIQRFRFTSISHFCHFSIHLIVREPDVNEPNWTGEDRFEI